MTYTCTVGRHAELVQHVCRLHVESSRTTACSDQCVQWFTSSYTPLPDEDRSRIPVLFMAGKGISSTTLCMGYVQQNQAISAPCCLLQGAVAYLLQKIEYRLTVAMGLKGAAGHITHANTIPGFASALTGHVLDRDISPDCSCTHGTCTVQRRRCVDDMSAVLMCCCRTLPGEANYSLCPYS